MVNHKDFSSRSEFDEHIAGILRANQIDLVILGGGQADFYEEIRHGIWPNYHEHTPLLTSCITRG